MPAEQASPGLISYQLLLRIDADIEVTVGKLGRFRFPAGRYVYTGSAKRNLEARIARHLRADKPLRWHIDYLTTHPAVRVLDVERAAIAECRWQQQTPGRIVAAGFGASDCRAGCGSHLKLIT